MKPMQKQDERIPAEDAGNYAAWSMPRIDAKGNILPSFEKEQRKRRGTPNESVETVEKPPAQPQRLTAQMLDAIREEASREGYQAGFQQGLQEGRQRGHDDAWGQARADIDARQRQLQQLCLRLLQPLHEEEAQIVELLQTQVEHIARAVIGRELLTDSGVIRQLVEEAFSALPTGSQHIRLYIHADDADTINTWLEETGIEARVLPDARLERGGCRVESEYSVVDYSVDARLQALLDSMQENVDSADIDMKQADDDGLHHAEF